jgi:putative phosphoesterase
MPKIGLISDTHGYVDPLVESLFDSVDHILHAGDIGSHAVLNTLENIAPVTAVLGNGDYNLPLRNTAQAEVGGLRFLLHHIVNPRILRDPFRSVVDQVRPDVVVFGHTHQRFEQRIGGVLFINPGYAGKPKLPANERSVAVLHCGDAGIRCEFFNLPCKPAW